VAANAFLRIFEPAGGGSFNAILRPRPQDGETWRFTLIGANAAQVVVTLTPNTGQTINLGSAGMPLTGHGATRTLVWNAQLSTWVGG